MAASTATPDTNDGTTSTSGAAQGSAWMEDADFLLRHAILAPSSHNTQPWIFEVHDDGLDVHADPTRWLRVADADRRELHVSLGCALENLRRTIQELTVRADEIQCADPAWRKELARWIGKGAFGTSWLLSKIGQIVIRYFPLARSMSETDQARLASAPLLGLVSTTSPTPADQVRAGQVFERLFLAATNAGLALQPMNQILQVPEVREELMDLLPEEWGTPQMTFRLGYADVEGRRTPSPRRPLEDVVRWHGAREA